MCKIKLNCNNVNDIREERIPNSIYIGSVTSCVYVQSSNSQSTWDFHYPYKFLYNFWTIQGYLSLVFRKTYKSRDSLHLDYNNSLLLKYRRFFSLFKKRDSLCITIACLWLDHPFVCVVRSFSIGKCIASLELDRTGLSYLDMECGNLVFIMF